MREEMEAPHLLWERPERNAVAEIQKTTREPESGRADCKARKGVDRSGPHQGSPNQVPTSLPPVYAERKHLVKSTGDLGKERAFWLRML